MTGLEVAEEEEAERRRRYRVAAVTKQAENTQNEYEEAEELLKLQNTGAKARVVLLLSKRAPPYPLYRYYHHPPTARMTIPETTSLTKTEGFASLALFDDLLRLSSPRCPRMLQRSKRKSRNITNRRVRDR